MKNAPLLILGGRSLPAPFLMARLALTGKTAQVASRRDVALPPGFEAIKLDLEAPGGWRAPEGTTIISLLPLWVLTERLSLFDKVKAVIAVSSTSRYGKAGSQDPHEQKVARKLAEGEEKLEKWAQEKGIIFTILRPTLIYDGASDQNVARIARTIRRFGTFPVAAPGKGLRQPIHADDVAGAIMGALDNPRAAGRAFNIAGGEILTYREMVQRIKQAVMPAPCRGTGRALAGIPFCFLPCPLLLPVRLLETAFRFLRWTGLLHERHFGFAVFARMNEDLVFDVKEGLEILAYEARKFSL